MNDFSLVLDNRIMWGALLAWFLAQAFKIILNLLVERKFDYHLLTGSGGFPSSHTAIVCALAIGIGKTDGWDSSLFAIAAALALIVMYDAAGVRRAAGNHARVINYLVERFSPDPKVERLGQNLDYQQQEKLKELIGHTPIEVFGGAILGIVIGLVF